VSSLRYCYDAVYATYCSACARKEMRACPRHALPAQQCARRWFMTSWARQRAYHSPTHHHLNAFFFSFPPIMLKSLITLPLRETACHRASARGRCKVLREKGGRNMPVTLSLLHFSFSYCQLPSTSRHVALPVTDSPLCACSRRHDAPCFRCFLLPPTLMLRCLILPLCYYFAASDGYYAGAHAPEIGR